MAKELDRTELVMRDLARGAVALTLLEELDEVTRDHDNRLAAVHADYRQRTHDANDVFVSRMLVAVRKCSSALDDLTRSFTDDEPDED